jgi:hypothetical protein
VKHRHTFANVAKRCTFIYCASHNIAIRNRCYHITQPNTRCSYTSGITPQYITTQHQNSTKHLIKLCDATRQHHLVM